MLLGKKIQGLHKGDDTMDTYIKVSKTQAIQILRDAIDRIDNMDGDVLFTLSIDLSAHGCSSYGQKISMCSGEKMINESATQIFSGNQYTSQIDLYSERQSNIYDIKPEGMLRTILLPGI